jgi:hypothetical protein
LHRVYVKFLDQFTSEFQIPIQGKESKIHTCSQTVFEVQTNLLTSIL